MVNPPPRAQPIIMTSTADRRRHVRKYRLASNAAASGMMDIRTASVYDAALVIAGRSADAGECRTLLESVGLL